MAERRALVGRGPGSPSVRRQCELLGLAVSTYYHRPRPVAEGDLLLMRLLDEQFTATPFYGVERMAWQLRQAGHAVGTRRVRRLLRLMGLMAVYPKPRLSVPGTVANAWPYLLGSLKPAQPDVAWATDITYIRLQRGFCYLCAIMDWHSRAVLAWRLSTSLEGSFCLDTLRDALAAHGRVPYCVNSDQGSQFTSPKYTGLLLSHGIKPSWDGRGRFLDNIFVERLWRSVKYECVYLHEWPGPRDAERGLREYFHLYNQLRPHSSLDKVPPAAVYFRTPYNPGPEGRRDPVPILLRPESGGLTLT